MFNLKFNIFKQPITKNGIDTFLHQPHDLSSCKDIQTSVDH